MVEETGNDTLSQTEEEVTELSAEEQLVKEKEVSNNYKIRAEKAETKLKDKSEEKPTPKTKATEEQNLASTDMLALMGSQITDADDVEYLQTVAKGFGMTIAEALKDPTIKAKLEEKQDERATAQATNTKGGSKGNSKITSESILKDAEKGNLPKSDEDMDRLVKARFEKK